MDWTAVLAVVGAVVVWIALSRLVLPRFGIRLG